MANTFTTNYSLVKSEIGGDNQNWGSNLHTSLNTVDSQLINKFDKDVVKGFTSTAIVFTNTGTSTGTITAASGDLFEDFEIGDRIRVTGATSDTNGSDSSPVIHTITNKSNSNSITVSTGLVTASAGDSVTVTLVFEPGYVDGSAIDNTPIGANTASTGAFSTVSATGQITSTVADGTAPLVVTSTTKVTNLNADTLDGQTAPSGTIVGTSDAQTLTNKTLTSPVINTGVSGSAILDSDTMSGVSATTLSSSESIKAYVDNEISNIGGKVLFKAIINATSLPSGTAPSSKTWIAYGSGQYTNDDAATYTAVSDALEVVRSGTVNNYTLSMSTVPSAITGSGDPDTSPGGSPDGGIMNKYSAAGYGHGDCIAIKSDGATSWTEILPNNVSTVKWSHYIQIDNA